MDLAALQAHPNALAPHYSRFRVAERLLLTGHSHQAWPDAGFSGQISAWTDAAEHVDDKWSLAMAVADRVRRGFSGRLNDPRGDYALGGSVHELLVRFLSALPLADRPRLVTTDGEFHSLRRQLDRLAEEGVEVVRIPAAPAESLAGRLAAAVDGRTAAALVSAVLFQSAEIVTGLDETLAACKGAGAELLIDAYHAVNVVPLPVGELGLDDAFITGGGYKYCQLGEGNCFLRLPPGCTLRPVVTGWFAAFDALEAGEGDGDGPVSYGAGPARFAGSTYDPTSHYRAAAVFDFFEDQELTPALLRRVSQHQVGLLARRFDALGLPPEQIRRSTTAPEHLGGFLALTSPRAGELCRALRRRGVHTDCRGQILRLGPAPYLSDAQLEEAVAILGQVASG